MYQTKYVMLAAINTFHFYIISIIATGLKINNFFYNTDVLPTHVGAIVNAKNFFLCPKFDIRAWILVALTAYTIF